MLNLDGSSCDLHNLTPAPPLRETKKIVNDRGNCGKFAGRQNSVMIFGTDKDTRLLFKTALEIWNYRVLEAETVEEALANVGGEPLGLVLMDAERELSLNFRAIRQLREHRSFNNASFLLVSGHAQEIVRKTAFEAGVDDFLVKPIDLSVLENAIKLLCQKFG